MASGNQGVTMHVKTTYLYFGFAEVDSPGQLLAYEGVGVVRTFKDSLERHELLTVERRSVASRFDACFARVLLTTAPGQLYTHTL